MTHDVPDAVTEEILTGGGLNEVVRLGDRVRRSRHPWSGRVNALLQHLETVGFRGAPRHVSSDDAYDYLEYLPGRVEVICHGDIAPYNCVFDGERVTAFIDFDTAHPGPRLRDIGYAVYRFAPLAGPSNDNRFGSPIEQAGRARLFCDAYGLDDRTHVVDAVVARLGDLVQFMRSHARAGHAGFASHVADGHDQLYLDDIAYIRAHATQISHELGVPSVG